MKWIGRCLVIGFLSTPALAVDYSPEATAKIEKLAAVLPAGNYRGEAYHHNWVGTYVRWSDYFCNVRVGLDKHEGGLSYHVEVDVEEPGEAFSTKVRAKFLLNNDHPMRRAIRKFEENDADQSVEAVVDLPDWENFHLKYAAAGENAGSFSLVETWPAFRNGGKPNKVFCEKLQPAPAAK